MNLKFFRHRALIVALLSLWSATSWAEAPPAAAPPAQAIDSALEAANEAAVSELPEADAPETDPEDPFARHLKRQASIEVQLGLRFFQEFDDYRAISALKRYAVLDSSPGARFLSALMIGQIYHRNEKPQLSALAFERAVEAAPDPEKRAFAYLLGVQELCLPLAYYDDCRSRLQQFGQTRLPEKARDIVDYQVLYTDVVLRS
jgi:tetratricopeptide (TPR) repeat protein